MSFFFFFKQKTAYEMLRSLVGSEMCIRDRREASTPQCQAPQWRNDCRRRLCPCSVSYTHLTLPTILRVLISVVAVSFTKNSPAVGVLQLVQDAGVANQLLARRAD